MFSTHPRRVSAAPLTWHPQKQDPKSRSRKSSPNLLATSFTQGKGREAIRPMLAKGRSPRRLLDLRPGRIERLITCPAKLKCWEIACSRDKVSMPILGPLPSSRHPRVPEAMDEFPPSLFEWIPVASPHSTCRHGKRNL